MKKTVNHFHGSDLELISEKYGVNKEDIINYSNNVNPLGISPKLREELQNNIDLIASYPDRNYGDLRKSISHYTGAPFENIIVGNGTTELISLAISNIQPRKCLILGPTYSEYEKEIYINNGEAQYYRLQEENNFDVDLADLKRTLTKEYDLLVICNPNNPTSSIILASTMRKILDHCKEMGIYVLIDETYIEFASDVSLASAVPFSSYYTNLIILRGVSKFFSAPGLRLGYLICGNDTIRSHINEKKNPWTINALASLAGQIILSDEEYIERTRELINDERERVYQHLSKWKSVKVYYPHANFLLLKILDKDITSHHIFEELIHKGIMVRDASSFPFLDSGFIRFCFLERPENDLLINELARLLNEEPIGGNL